jgi:hypothetical protein
MDKVHKTITSQYYTPSSKPFRIYILYVFAIPIVRDTGPVHPILFDVIILAMCVEERKILSCLLGSFLPPTVTYLS